MTTRTTFLASALLLLLAFEPASTTNKVWVLSKQEMEGDGCNFNSYVADRNNCEKMFSNVSVITSGNNTCSDVQIYIACVKDAMRRTLCSANDTIKENENARIMMNVRKKNVTCIPKAAPQNMRQMMSCLRPLALKKFFACSSTFHYYVKNKDDVSTIGNGGDCSVATGYKDCVLLGLKHSDCADDKEFAEHVLYFMRNDISALAKSCRSEKNSPNSNAAGSKTCNEDKAIDTYLMCAKKFFENVDSEELRNLAKFSVKSKSKYQITSDDVRRMLDSTLKPDPPEELRVDPCTAVKSWLNCYYDDLVKLNCSTDSELYKRSQSIYQVMVDEFNCVNTQFQALASSDTLDCQEKPMLNNFFICAINYNVERKGIPLSLQIKPEAVCPSNQKFEMCVAQAMRESSCLHERMKIMHHLKYLTDVITMPRVTCNENNGEYSRQIQQRDKRCAKTVLYKEYFTCGLSFQKELEMHNNFVRDDTGKERCTTMNSYNECFRRAVDTSECHSKSAVTDTMLYLMELETKGIDYNCEEPRPVLDAGIISTRCSKNLAVKNSFLCAMTFEHLVEDLKVKREATADKVCKYLEDMNSCVDIVKKSTGCDRDGEIFNHVSPILHSLTHEYDRACRNVTNSFRMSFVQLKSQDTCIRQRVLKKMFVCGLSFSNLFDEMEPRAVGSNPVKCKLLIDYEQCIAKASRGTGCDEDAEMRVQIMSFSDIMRDEYKDSCPNMVYKNSPEAPEAFEDYEEDWADSDPYWYDSKENSEAHAASKARKASAPMNRDREDPFGNIPDKGNAASPPLNHGSSNDQQRGPAKERILSAAMKPDTLRQQVGSLSNNATISNEMELASFLGKDPKKLSSGPTNLKRKVQIEKEYLDDSPAAMASYGFGSDYKDDYGDSSFARTSNKRIGLRSRTQQRRGDPNVWVNNRRAMKILDDEEQQEDDDIMGLMRRKRKRMGSETVRKLGKDLQVKKQLDYDDDGEDDDILTDRETHISGDECNLKQLKRQSETCDRTFSDSIKVSWSKDWPGSSSTSPVKEVQDKLCNSLLIYRTCLLDTAKRMHCGEIAGKVAIVVEEQMKKLGVAFCAASASKVSMWTMMLLPLTLLVRYALQT
ncbi:uncharacterized protein LOC8050598 [Ixodes scapularis]|uniref:uncharacterized protein LOC8050598 n=1 Tax=Ixodes scapularis TaxID=6945 RepID=UPI001A9CD8AB|nr:uncharacterized protein LOC8050598 [Ixodes scapularis]